MVQNFPNTVPSSYYFTEFHTFMFILSFKIIFNEFCFQKCGKEARKRRGNS